MKSNPSLTRRRFLKASAAATFAFQIAPRSVWGANDRIQVGCIGVGGKGQSDTLATAAAGGAIVALCDVADPRRAELGRRKKAKAGGSMPDQFPQAKFFSDYREMIATMPGLDAVTVSTPDHHHFHASALAMRRGKHVYCQKPIAHSVWEARRLAEIARETRVKTQMGNQAHAGEPIRRALELIRSGVLGRVHEVHAWTNRPIWPQGIASWPAPQPVPTGLNWDLWIGPAPWREYSPEIAPFNWRGYWDFGAGALGDMGCHILDMPYWALDLGSPESVEATQEGGTEISAPLRSKVTYHYARSFFGGPARLLWYDGVAGKEGQYVNTPPEELWKADFPTADHVFRRFDMVVVGEKGRMFFNRARTDWVYRPESLTAGWTEPPPSLPRVPRQEGDGAAGEGLSPYVEWLQAIRSGKEALSNFAASGPFSETVLLGNIALRLGRKVTWDARTLSVANAPEAAAMIRRPYRKGWELA